MRPNAYSSSSKERTSNKLCDGKEVEGGEKNANILQPSYIHAPGAFIWPGWKLHFEVLRITLFCVFDVKLKKALYFFREVSFTLFFLSWAIYHRRDKIGRSALHDGSPLSRSALVTSLPDPLPLFTFATTIARSTSPKRQNRLHDSGVREGVKLILNFKSFLFAILITLIALPRFI